MTRDIRSFFASNDSQPRKKLKSSYSEEDAKNTDLSSSETKLKPADSDRLEGECLDIIDSSAGITYLNLRIHIQTLMHPSWYKLLKVESEKAYFKNLLSFLECEARVKVIFPVATNVFAALRDCPFENLRVVIIGQDPYHGPSQAHGVSFSVCKGVATPPSLRNIIKEAVNDVGIQVPSHGCLTSWCQQGVLLLNTVLTVRKGEANSHSKKGWEKWTDCIIRTINKETRGTVFLLWGKPAQEKESMIDSSVHHVIKTSHPSPLGATKTATPFIGSRCFSRANKYLKQQNREPVDWNIV